MDSLTTTNQAERRYLTRDEYAKKHGASKEDIDQIQAFAKANGLKVIDKSAARRTVVLSGTVDQMNKAFAVDLGHYQAANMEYRGREGAIHVPEQLADIIDSVHGLDDRPVASPKFRPAATGIASPKTVTPLTPNQVARLYDFPTNNANGQTVAILEFGGGYKQTDINAYFNNIVHMPIPAVSSVAVDGVGNHPGASADLEVVLDIDVVGAAAPGAKIVVYFAPNSIQGFVDAITTAVHDNVNKPSVISISWGGDEANFGGGINNVSAALAEAAAVGVTVFVSSGDSGSQNPARVEYPASDPWVVGCGGTTVQNVSGSSFSETTWAGSGGGISNAFAKPGYQAWANIPPSVNPAGHIGRGVPDVAGNADPASGYRLVLNGATTGSIGGTSAVAPLYAALTALVNAATGEPCGFLNYNLYTFAGPYVFRDITTGNNGLYHATTNWDACTGLGSIDGMALVNSLWGVAMPPAMDTFNAKLMMCWKGIERDDRIFTNNFNGASWSAQAQVPGIATSHGPAIAVFNGKQYMAWKGMHEDQRIWWSAFNGATWSAQQIIPGVGTSHGPRLAVFNGKLYAAWKGVENDQRLFWSSFNGTSWAAQQQIPAVASSVGPALCTFNGALYAVWKGMYGDNRLWYSKFNGTSWTAQQMIPGVGSSNGPSLAVFGGKLYAAWKGVDSDQRLWWSSFDGTNWAPQQQIPGVASSVGPGLTVFGTQLYACWKGMLGDQRIWFSHFNGASWAPQQIVPGVGTSGDLVAHVEEASIAKVEVIVPKKKAAAKKAKPM